MGLLGNNLLAGSNGKIASLVGQQVHARQEQENQGNLYNAVQDARGGAEGRLGHFSDADNERRMGVADLSERRYTNYLNRPRKPSIWEQLLGNFTQGLGTAAGAAAF